MQAFEYASPSTVKEATALLGASWADAQVLAGGTDLISLMKDYIETPRRVVNIKNIKELNGISANKTGVRIGALVYGAIARASSCTFEYLCAGSFSRHFRIAASSPAGASFLNCLSGGGGSAMIFA